MALPRACIAQSPPALASQVLLRQPLRSSTTSKSASDFRCRDRSHQCKRAKNSLRRSHHPCLPRHSPRSIHPRRSTHPRSTRNTSGRSRRDLVADAGSPLSRAPPAPRAPPPSLAAQSNERAGHASLLPLPPPSPSLTLSLARILSLSLSLPPTHSLPLTPSPTHSLSHQRLVHKSATTALFDTACQK